MEHFCDCKDSSELLKNFSNTFVWHPPYGWVLSLIDLTEEKGYTQVHRYGVVIYYCPICGKKLKSDKEDG